MIKLLKTGWKAIEMAKKMMTDLIRRIKSIMTILKKNLDNQSRKLLDIEMY